MGQKIKSGILVFLSQTAFEDTGDRSGICLAPGLPHDKAREEL
jgi:hypothetical protein